MGLVLGCGDELGHSDFFWDAGLRPRAGDGGSVDARRDASGDALRIDGFADVGDEIQPDVSVDGPDARSATEGGRDTGQAEASDARADAAVDPEDVLRLLLQRQSPTCLACAEASCPGELIGCSTVAGAPDAGRDAGTRAQLCVETLGCLVEADCDETDPSSCYCGEAPRANDICSIYGTANGVCKVPIERSFETTDPKRVLAGIASTDRETGGGWAFLVTRCLRDNHCPGCFGRRRDAGADAKPPDAPRDATIDPSRPPVDVAGETNVVDASGDMSIDTADADAAFDGDAIADADASADDDATPDGRDDAANDANLDAADEPQTQP